MLTGYSIFFTESPLLDVLPHLAVTVSGTCIWWLVNNVRSEIDSALLADQEAQEDMEGVREVAL